MRAPSMKAVRLGRAGARGSVLDTTPTRKETGNAPGRRAFRPTVALRLLLALAGLVSFSTATALLLQDRALARDLERAAAERLDRATHAADRLVANETEALEERYRAVSGTPQLHATLEVQHTPTLAFYARELQRRGGPRLLAFLDRDGRVTASAGDDSLLPIAETARGGTLTALGGEPWFVATAELRTSAGPVGRLVAVELEITESTVMHDEAVVIEILGRLREMGVTVSLDDFGTGYSSLSYLRRLPVDTLKIDMTFVRYIARSAEDAALTAAIVAMGKARGLRVIAEGVETAEQRRLLRAWGCDEIQGFLIAAALPAAAADGVRGASFPEDP